MSGHIIDVLYVKMIEKTISRPLTEEEMDYVYNGETIFVTDKRGTWMSFTVPILQFPFDVMPKDSDINMLEELLSKENIFDFAFTIGVLKKARLDA